MKIIDFFDADNQPHWLSEIRKSDWSAGQYLHTLLSDGSLRKMTGQTARVLMLADGDHLVSFCTLAPMDDIQPTELTPWIGFVYTFPEYRGHRHMGRLLAHAEILAAEQGHGAVYISTGETGLYEKYGYRFLRMDTDMGGSETRVYCKQLNAWGERR